MDGHEQRQSILAVDDPVPTGRIGLPPRRSYSRFDEFYQAEADGLYRALAATIGNSDLAGDAIDEGMARAFKRWRRISRYDNPGGWVYRVSLNWAIDRMAKTRNEVSMADVIERPHETGIDVDLERALMQLSSDARAVVVLRYLLGYSSRETADALDIAEGTVKSRLSRALNELQDLIGDAR